MKFGDKIDLAYIGLNSNLPIDSFFYDGETLYMDNASLDSKHAEYICNLGFEKKHQLLAAECAGFIHDKYVMYVGGEDEVFKQRYADILKEKK